MHLIPIVYIQRKDTRNPHAKTRKSLRNEKEFETKMQKNKNWNNINKDKKIELNWKRR